MKKITKILSVALLAVMCLTLLVACAPNSDPDKAAAALKENDYITVKTESNALKAVTLLLGIDGVECMVSGTGTSEDKDGNTHAEHVTIWYFESSSAAKSAMNKLQSKSDEENKDNDNDWVFKQFGSMIYYGTKNGVKAAM